METSKLPPPLPPLRRTTHCCPKCGEWEFEIAHHSYINRYGGEEDTPSTYGCGWCGHEIADYTDEWDAYVKNQDEIDRIGLLKTEAVDAERNAHNLADQLEGE